MKRLPVKECDSVGGQWGGRCPKCRQQLPSRPGPLRSWKSQRDTDLTHVQPPPPTSWLRKANRIK